MDSAGFSGIFELQNMCYFDIADGEISNFVCNFSYIVLDYAHKNQPTGSLGDPLNHCDNHFRSIALASTMSVLISACLVAIALTLGYQYNRYINRIETLSRTYAPLSCHKIGDHLLHGPEDIAFSRGNGLLFVSSHNRRNMSSTGSLYTVNVTSEVVRHFDILYPDNFRPHGMAIAQCESLEILFVISHRHETNMMHTIEVFEYNLEHDSLEHVRTLASSKLVSPNDLIALDCNRLIVSNDHGDGILPRLLWDDVTQSRRSDMVYFDGKDWHFLNTYAAFGNGLILHHQAGRDYLLRSSAADYSLLTYEILQSQDEHLTLRLVHDEKLPLSPDNIEFDEVTGGVVITGHPSTGQFVLHAALHLPSPSASILYHGFGNYSSLYYDNGQQLSASSVAVRTIDGKKVFIGQVFDSFLLMCA